MNDRAYQKLYEKAFARLREIVARYGPGVVEDPRRLRAFFSDLCPGMPRQVNTLMAAVEQQIVAELRGSAATVPWGILAGRLVRRLVDETAMAEQDARWVVSIWGRVFGRTQATPPPLPAKAPRSQEEVWVEVVPVQEPARPSDPGKGPLKPAKEVVLYRDDDDVLITNYRAVLDGCTYHLKQVVAVTMIDMPSRVVFPLVTMLVGFFFMIGLGIMVMQSLGHETAGYVIIGSSLVAMLAGIIFLASVAGSKYIVEIRDRFGESEALVSNDEDYVERIVVAINKAIAMRQ